MKICKDVMTPSPICCLPTDNVAAVAQIMKRENIGPMPVIDNQETRKLIGIITDRDLAMKIVGEGRDVESTKVEAVMTRKVVTCREDDELQRALKLMSEHQLRRIVIVDHTNMVVGIISQADLATRMNQPEKTAEVVKDISQSITEKE
jgi:CBS domain-containing protein